MKNYKELCIELGLAYLHDANLHNADLSNADCSLIKGIKIWSFVGFGSMNRMTTFIPTLDVVF